MWKKIALNVFFNLGIIVSGLVAYWSFNNEKYLITGIFVLTLALFAYLKINLIKDFRRSMKR